MDKKLSHTITVLDALSSYYESLHDYLKQSDASKLEKLNKWIKESDDYKTSFIKVVKRSKVSDEDAFEIIHLFTSLIGLLKKIYNTLDFKLPIGEEISKTRGFRLTEVFNKVTTIYRLYIRDIATELSSFVNLAATTVKTTKPDELQKYWQKWPNSIDLYTFLITKLLNNTFQEKDLNTRTRIYEILDADKSFILNEKKWISPFLTFNCVPFAETLLPVKFSEITRLIGSTSGKGVITISRVISGENNKIHALPKAVEWGPGINSNDIHESLISVKSDDIWNWSIDIKDSSSTTEYCIIENLGSDQWRILVPWKFPRIWIIRDTLVTKIKDSAFGRPNAYHTLLESSLKINNRVANLVTEIARKTDVGLNILRVTELLMVEVKQFKKFNTLIDILESPTLDKIFENAILHELHDKVHLLDALLYWLEWTRRDFRKELDILIAKNYKELNTSTVDVASLHNIQEILHKVVASLLKENKNIFQDLLDKQHKLDVVFSNT